MNKLTQWILNIVAGVFFFFVFLFLFFPFESLIQNFLSRVETQSKGAYRITVGTVEPGIVFKTVFKDFKVHQLADGEDLLLVDLPEIRVGMSYFSLLTGKLKASFDARGKNGKMEGRLVFSEEEYLIETDMKGMQFQDIRYLSTLVHLPLDGMLDGTIDFQIFPGQVAKDEGAVDLKLRNLKIGASRVTPYPGFDLDLPETILSDEKGGVIKLEMGEGKLELKELNFPGEDLNLNLSGRIQLNKKKDLSRLALNGSFRVSKKLQDAFPFMVMIEGQKKEDGSYPLTLSGRLAKPRVQVGTFDVL